MPASDEARPEVERSEIPLDDHAPATPGDPSSTQESDLAGVLPPPDESAREEELEGAEVAEPVAESIAEPVAEPVAEPISNPTVEPMETPEPLRLSVPRPRCPFCHEGIAPGALQEACKACRAWHHEACWREGRSRCSACRAPAVKQAIHLRVGGDAGQAGVDSDLAMSWTVVATGSLAYSLLQIPLRDMYRLHEGTLGHAMTNAWSAIPTIAALSCLFLATALRPGRWRRVLHWVAWSVVALTGLLALYAGAFPPPVPWEGGSFRAW